MTDTTIQKTDLQNLDDILQQERAALISLNMVKLKEIRRQKELLVTRIRANLHTPSAEELELIAKVKRTIHHNSHLLLSGLKVVSRQQKFLRDRSAMTYGKDATPALSATPQMMAMRA